MFIIFAKDIEERKGARSAIKVLSSEMDPVEIRLIR